MKTSVTSQPAPAIAGTMPASSAGGDRPGRRHGSAPRPQPPPLSREAKQRAAAILEVLAGGRTPAEAAQALAVSLSRYYLLETRALQGLLAACEPAPRGPGPDERRALAALRAECDRWKRECARQQALVRAAQRTIGLAAPAPPAKAGRKRKPRKPVARALQAVARLQQEAAAAAASTEASLQS
ncbi:MAG TPA: hypothetical protein VG013_30110 [Gemmataceae bacterium]|jgi:hypothetical protein|nr:hypothetical protein [Gemmataceae bacterium]